MNIYEVQPIFSHPTHPFELTIDAPGSKSITNRALMLAALANGETLLKGALFSDDSRHFLQCLKDLGFDVVVDEPAHTVRVTGLGGRIPKGTAAINVGSAGCPFPDSHAGLCQRCLASGCFRTDEEASHGCPFKHFNRSGLPH